MELQQRMETRMKRLLFIMILFQGCEHSTPVGPREVALNPVGTSLLPAVSAGAAPSPGVQLPGDGELSWRLSPTDDTWVVEVTNSFGKKKNVFAACFNDPDRDIATQTLYHPHPTDRGGIYPGESRTFSAPIPCGQWQCDAVEGEVVPKTAPFFGSNLIVGRIGTRACAPAPAREPAPAPACSLSSAELLAKAVEDCGFLEVESIDFEACTFECGGAQ